MRRREFIALMGGAAAAWPLAARAQQATGRPLIGVLSPTSPAAATRNIEALREGLRDLGYVEDRNVALALRFAGGAPARLPELAAELVALKPDVILAGSIAGILAARNATRRIPLIMMVISEHPVALGLVNSITRGPVAISRGSGCSLMTRWSANGSSFSSSRCPTSCGSG
jgi:putative ABC transport system substrate-binding protein